LGCRYWIGAVRDVFVGVGEWGERLSEVPRDVGGEHAEEDVRADSFGQVVEDGPQIEVVDFDDSEVAFDVCEVLVGGDDAGRVQSFGGDAGADDVDAIEVRFGSDLFGVVSVG
jgi:hypothetical protein